QADGRRIGATETFWIDSVASVNELDWTYDALGRLIEESLDSYDNALDYTTEYEYDLVGNRLTKTVDEGSNSSVDEITEYDYDANDRLTTEEIDSNADSTVDQTTTYGYDVTQQTSKT